MKTSHTFKLVFFKVGPLEQQHQSHLGTLSELPILHPSPSNQQLGGVGCSLCFNKCSSWSQSKRKSENHCSN